MAKLSVSMLASAKRAEFNASEWKPTGETHTLKEIWDELHPGQYEQIEGTTAEVIAREFESGVSLRLEIPFKDGTSTELRLGSKDLEGKPLGLMEGDEVSIDSIVGQQLRKLGEDEITRYVATKVED